MKTKAKQTGVYYGMYVYAIEADNGQRVELPPSVDPTIEGLAGLLDSDKDWGTDADRAIVEAHLTALMRGAKLKEIEAYDSSPAVNSFCLDGMAVWLDKATRVGLMNSLNCEKAAGRTETTLWLGTTPFTLNVEQAIQLLAAVELYALQSFNVTASHRAAVEVLATRNEIEAYDYTAGYPARLDIKTT